jgi:hypothetical protein
MKRTRYTTVVVVAVVAIGALYAGRRASAGFTHSFLDALEGNPAVTATTQPANGDGNPYGVVVVPFTAGVLHRGDILVSNFNNSGGAQGTGSTIVRVDPTNPATPATVFFDSTATPNLPIGLDTALLALRGGFVVVGAAPNSGTGTVLNGALIFLDANGHVALTLTDSALLNGPWDATVDDRDADEPRLFVTNVLTGTIVRIRLKVHAHKTPGISVESITKIASGFAFRTDPTALVIGPTGLALDEECHQLFVADTGNNRIAVIDPDVHFDQGAGRTVFSGAPLNGPLGLVHVPGFDHLVAANGDAILQSGQPGTPPQNLVVELTEHGKVVTTKQLDPGTLGALFGITLTRFQGELSLVWVDDNANSVLITKTK